MKKNVRLGAIAAAAMLAFVFTGCPQPAGGGSKNSTVTVTDDEGNEISVVKTGETKSADITTQDFGAVLAWNKEEKSYATSSKIEFEELPKKGDELEVEVEFTISASDVESVKGRFLITDENGKIYKTDQTKLTVSSTAKAAEDSDGVTVKGKVKGVAAVNAEAVSVEIEVKITDDTEGKAIITAESGKGITEDGKYFKAETDSKGIKVTLADELPIQSYQTVSVSVEGVPLHATVSESEYKQDGKRVIIFPFVEKDKTYYLHFGCNMIADDVGTGAYFTETIKCTAGGGVDYKEYLDTEVLANASMTLEYSPAKEKYFSGTYKLSSTDIIKKADAFSKAEIGFGFNLGYMDYTPKGSWWTGSDDHIDLLGEYKEETPYAIAGWAPSDVPSKAQWAKFDNSIAAAADVSFTFKDYGNFGMACGRVQQSINNPRKLPTEAEAFADGIKNVKTFISSEEDLLKAIKDAVTETMISAMGPGRSATSSEAAVKQGKEFAKAVYEQFVALQNSLTDLTDPSKAKFKVDFDKTIDVGAMSAMEWKSAISDTIDFLYINLLKYPDYYDWGGQVKSELNPIYNMEEQIKRNIDQSKWDDEEPLFASLNDFYDFLDEVLLLKQFYFNTKADIDFDYSKIAADNTTKIGDAALDVKVALAALDVNKFLKKTGAPVEVPVNALSLAFAGNLDFGAAYSDIAAIMEMEAEFSEADKAGTEYTPDFSKLKDLAYKLNGDLGLKAALCTKDGLGGIVSVDASYSMDVDKLIKIAGKSKEINSGNTEEILKIADDVVSVKVSVSDGNTETFSKSYKPTDLYTLISAQFTE